MCSTSSYLVPWPCGKGFAGTPRVQLPCWTSKRQSLSPSPVIREGQRIQSTTPLRAIIRKGLKLVDHWPGEHESSEFRLRRCDGVHFITAKVLWTRGDEPLSHGDEPLSHAYVNVWAGRDLYGPGTLYCSMAHRPGYEHCCLCGRCCRYGWQDRGWMCQNVST